ncbi:MAG: TatD family hydrolase, partial [Patescibacteria group bacterium]
MKLIDIHAHLQFPEFDEDRERVIGRARAAGIGVINVGTDLETSQAAVALAEANPEMWATVGLHPTDLPAPSEVANILSELTKLASQPKVVAIGECGLDTREPKFDLSSESGRRQVEIFERQIELAIKVKKPLMLHIRRAYDEVLGVLSNFKNQAVDLRANVHFFAGDWSTASQFLDRGFSLSFTGVITFPPKAGQPRADAEEVIKKLPLDRLMVETDCPFVAPVPQRGRRNEPVYVEEVVKQLAILRHLPPAAIEE